METREVRAGRDHILGLAEGSSAFDAVAELIWNALDAEATEVEVSVSVGELGAAEELVVRDNGGGMSYAFATEVFLVEGDSWKKRDRFSPNIRRPLHGQYGSGRFKTYALAASVRWETVDRHGEKTVIRGDLATPNRFGFDGPFATDETSGTRVTLSLLQSQKVNRLVSGDFVLPLTARLASALFALTEVSVSYRGVRLDPTEHVVTTSPLPLVLEEELSHAAPELLLTEWTQDMKARVMFLCDQDGSVVTEHPLERMPPAPLHWTAYLRWAGFRDPSLMTITDLKVPSVRHSALLAAAERAVVDYLATRLSERKRELIPTWKAEGVYPYLAPPGSPTEEVERELFDIVAVVASPGIGRDTKQKKLSLRLLREAVTADPVRTRKALSNALSLTEDEEDMLAELLERTSFGAVVRAAHNVASRADFVRGLRRLLYADDTRRIFREVDQLHPLLVREPWVFGDEWTFALAESGLTNVVKTLMPRLGKDVVYAPLPVKLESGRSGRVDLVFYQSLPESESTRNLVVELKRASRKIGGNEFTQLNNYASAITSHPQVVGTKHLWEFWLVGTDVDTSVRNLLNDPQSPGVSTVSSGGYRLSVITWGQLLDRAERRIEAYRAALDLVATEETARAYLQRTHAEFMPLPPSAA